MGGPGIPRGFAWPEGRIEGREGEQRMRAEIGCELTHDRFDLIKNELSIGHANSTFEVTKMGYHLESLT